MSDTSAFDAIILGGGHNGLAAAAYLAQAGKSVLLLEKLEHAGGAAVSARAFDGVDARLSRYSYLVSLLPRAASSRTSALRVRTGPAPVLVLHPGSGSDGPGLADRTTAMRGHGGVFRPPSAPRTANSAAFDEFYAALPLKLTQAAVADTDCQPLRTRSEAAVPGRRRTAPHAGLGGTMIEQSDRRRRSPAPADERPGARRHGLTDALIGTFARDRRRRRCSQNVCFLYHLLGSGTGEWDVPIGGMGAVSGALASCRVRRHGAES